jgi:multiple sugar transport system permease protein
MASTDRRFAILCMAPAAVFLAIFVAYPLGRLLYDSLFAIEPGIGGSRTFIGLENFADAFASKQFRNAAWITVVYTVLVVAFEFVLGLAIALLFSALGEKSRVFRTVFLYPLMIAPVVAGLLWKFLLIDNFGILGTLLANVGILSNPNQIGWLSNPHLVLYAVAIPDIWLTTSFMCLVFFAGLQNLPGELIEAARIDGARSVSLLFRVIIPLLRPVIAVALVVRGIDAARAFDVIVVESGGGPRAASETLSLLIYRTMTRFNDPGSASAMSAIYLGVMLVVAVVAVSTIWNPGKPER